MAEKTTRAKIFDDLVDAIKSVIEPKYIFLGNRPKIDKDNVTMDKFAVIELPTRLRDVAVGKRKFLLETTGIFYLLTKSKTNNTLNVNAASDFEDNVLDLFPISGSYIAAVHPVTIMNKVDEYGYQVTSIMFEIHTK